LWTRATSCSRVTARGSGVSSRPVRPIVLIEG
jgi:hypothetical protein